MEIVYWHWWVLGLILLVAEMLSPTGFFLLWLGAAAILVGAVSWLAPSLGWEVEMILFGVLSVASFFVWRRFRPFNVVDSDQPSLNRRGHSYVGRTFTLAAPIVNGVGTLHVDDSQWRISGPDVPAGTQVRVTAADGATLRVDRA
jgi:membrane protein implicated in regulation of membrane protease activity